MRIRIGYDISLRVSAADADDPDAARASVARRRTSWCRTRCAPSPPCRSRRMPTASGTCAAGSSRPAGETRLFCGRRGERHRRARPGRSHGAPARRSRTCLRRRWSVSPAQPLLRDRSHARFRVEAVSATRRPGWPRVQAICDFAHNHVAFGYRPRACDAHRARSARRARRRVPRLHASRGDAVPLHEHPGALLHRLPRRHRRAAAVPGPMDFAAWFEAYLDGRWHVFDARNHMPRIGRVADRARARRRGRRDQRRRSGRTG